MSFQITALCPTRFDHLFDLPIEQLSQRGATRVTVGKKPGFPCRVSLVDAEIGEEVLLVNYQHLDVGTPFRSTYAIYVRPRVKRAESKLDEIPEALQSRLLSVRGFREPGILVAADVVPGQEAGQAIEKIFADPDVSFIHLHYAKPGCYAARVNRAAETIKHTSHKESIKSPLAYISWYDR